MKKKRMKSNNRIIVPGIIVGLAVVAIIAIGFIICKNNYKIIVNDIEYNCSVRKKYDGTILRFPKDLYQSQEEAMEACKQDEIIIYSPNGELEEYQEERKLCKFKDEDEENYYFYPQNGYNYTECIQVKD